MITVVLAARSSLVVQLGQRVVDALALRTEDSCPARSSTPRLAVPRSGTTTWPTLVRVGSEKAAIVSSSGRTVTMAAIMSTLPLKSAGASARASSAG